MMFIPCQPKETSSSYGSSGGYLAAAELKNLNGMFPGGPLKFFKRQERIRDEGRALVGGEQRRGDVRGARPRIKAARWMGTQRH